MAAFFIEKHAVNNMPWKKGESGNPNGRPRKGNTLTEALEAEFTPQELAAKLRELVAENNLAAIKYVYDRVEGKPRETIETIIESPKVIWFADETDTEDSSTQEEQ